MGELGLRGNRYEVFPVLSRVNNIGDEGGAHAHAVSKDQMQAQRLYHTSEHRAGQPFHELDIIQQRSRLCRASSADTGTAALGFKFGTDTVVGLCWNDAARKAHRQKLKARQEEEEAAAAAAVAAAPQWRLQFAGGDKKFGAGDMVGAEEMYRLAVQGAREATKAVAGTTGYSDTADSDGGSNGEKEGRAQARKLQPFLLHNLGLCLGNQGKATESVVVLKEAFGLLPSSADLGFSLGNAHLQLALEASAEGAWAEALEEARSNFARVLELSPLHEGARENLAVVQEEAAAHRSSEL
jgi:tetratricopeptide (TPR) repeat protein